MRFYPDSVPPFPNEPTSDTFEIRKIGDDCGQGVISKADFQPGDVVFNFTGFLMNQITQFSLQVREGVHLHDPFFMGKVLHHCAPNCHVDMENRRFVAIRPIKAGDLITMDYDQTEDILFKPFECCCDAPDCRMVIRGRKVPRNQAAPMVANA